MVRSIIFLLFLASCVSKTKQGQGSLRPVNFKDSFLFNNLKKFEIDSTLLLELSTSGRLSDKFSQPNSDVFDSLLGINHYILYSWQNSSLTKTIDFTVLKGTHIEHGLEIHYIKLGENNNKYSDDIVARWRTIDENGISYKQSPEIISGDTILVNRVAIYSLDQETFKPLSHIISDTTCFELKMGLKSNAVIRLIKSVNVSDNYKDENGKITEKSIRKNNTQKHHR